MTVDRRSGQVSQVGRFLKLQTGVHGRRCVRFFLLCIPLCSSLTPIVQLAAPPIRSAFFFVSYSFLLKRVSMLFVRVASFS
mgnify:CR=1 FL=1